MKAKTIYIDISDKLIAYQPNYHQNAEGGDHMQQ